MTPNKMDRFLDGAKAVFSRTGPPYKYTFDVVFLDNAGDEAGLPYCMSTMSRDIADVAKDVSALASRRFYEPHTFEPKEDCGDTLYFRLVR